MVSPIRLLCTTGFTLGILGLAMPATASAQATAVKCKDGTTSAITGRGACTSHGGVDKTATKVEKKTVKAEEETAKAVVKSTPEMAGLIAEARLRGTAVTLAAAGRSAAASRSPTTSSAAAQAQLPPP